MVRQPALIDRADGHAVGLEPDTADMPAIDLHDAALLPSSTPLSRGELYPDEYRSDRSFARPAFLRDRVRPCGPYREQRNPGLCKLAVLDPAALHACSAAARA